MEEKYAELFATVKDIDKDVDCIRDEICEEKRMGGGMNNFLAGLLSGQNRNNDGLGAAELMAMCNQNGLGGNGIWLLIILFCLFGGGFGGGFNRFNNTPGGAAVAADLTGQLITQGQNFTQKQVEQLATMIGCKVDDLSAALCSISRDIAKVSGDIGLSAQQIVNAVQAGDANVISVMQKCCCDNQLQLCQMTNTLQNTMTAGFSSLGFAGERNTNAIVQAIQAEGRATREQENAHYCQAQIDARDARIAQLEREKAEQLALTNTTFLNQKLIDIQAAIARIPTTTTTA